MNTPPLIISCAVVGAELNRKIYPSLPLSPDEIAASAISAVNAGASIIHLHVRDENGKPTQRTDLFEAVSRKIKSACDCILQFSTGGAVGTPLSERLAPLRLQPEMATLSMGSMNFGEDLYENTQTTICALAREMSRFAVFPELEIFDYGMLYSMDRMRAQGWLPERFHVNFVLGVPGGMRGTIKDLFLLVDHLEAAQSWSVAGIGKYQLPLSVHAIAMGGHVRVGLEDNIYFRKGEFGESNAQFVQRVVRIADELDRPVATAAAARKILGIPREETRSK